MGLWGKVRSVFSGKPSAPGMREYSGDPYFAAGGRGREKSSAADEALFRLTMQEANRIPGLTQAEKAGLYEIPQARVVRGSQAAERAINRTAGATNRFGTGGRERKIGSIRSERMRASGDLAQQAQLKAIQFARDDRERQIANLRSYTDPRLSMGLQETGMRNQYNMGLNELAMQKWLEEMQQYNKDFDFGWGLLNEIGSAAMGGMA